MQDEQINKKNSKKIKIPRTKIAQQNADQRIKNFNEVELGYTEEEALAESSRCLMCKKPKCIEGCPVEIDIKSFIALIKDKEYKKRLIK